MIFRPFTPTASLIALIMGLGAGSVVTSAATVFPPDHAPVTNIHNVDCVIGAHIGPLGGCILGSDPQPVVVQQAPVVVDPAPVAQDSGSVAPPIGCSSKSVTTTDAAGNSATKTKTQC